MTGEQMHRALIEAAEQWNGEKLQQWIEQTALADDPSAETIRERFAQRWGEQLDGDAVDEVQYR